MILRRNPSPDLRAFRLLPPVGHVTLVILLLLLAAFFRLYRLDSVPPGLTHDEASNGHDAAGVLRGVRPIYFTVGYGHEPLYPYSVALVMSLLGTTDAALRLTTVGWGMALILLSYVFARRLFGPLAALLTAAWMAPSFWCVMTSRMGLRAITLVVTFTASACCFWLARSLRRGETAPPTPSWRTWTWWALSGLSLGASIYTYMASRAMPAVYLLFLFYLLLLKLLGGHSSPLRQHWPGIVVVLLLAALVAAPLVHFLITHPQAEQRVGQLVAPLQEAARGDFSSLRRNLLLTLPMFTFRGDVMWRYNIPGRPLLDPVSGVLFYAGILLCLYRWRDPRYAFLLLWLIVGAAPALVAGPDATTLRSIAAQPVVFVVIALTLAATLRLLSERAGRWGRIAGVSVVAALVVGIGADTAHAYFDVWGEHREVRVTYYHALVQQARYLDAQPEGGTVAFSSLYPGRFHDPYTVEVVLRRDDLSLRWFDGRSALVSPAGGNARVIVPSITPLDEALEPLFEGYATHLYRENFRPDDLISHFDVYRFDADAALAAFLSGGRGNPVYFCPGDVFPSDEPLAGCEPLALPVNVGDVVELIGYDLRTLVVGSGQEVELLTAWRVRAPFTLEAVIFVHLLDHNGRVAGQMDRLDFPSWHWRSNDAFVQVHRFSPDVEAPSGLYHLETGVYTREDLRRLPVLMDGVAVDDRVFLSPVEVVSP